jgi:hypothetical protein
MNIKEGNDDNFVMKVKRCMAITEYDESVSNETRNTDEREENEDCLGYGALEFMVKSVRFIAPQK